MPKILLADDDSVQRSIYHAVFEDAKFQVVQAGDGEEALDKFNSDHPDIIFTGIMMPKMNGFDLIKKIRETKPNFPAMIFSHLGKPEDKSKAQTNNIVFMVKGLNSPAQILKKAKELLSQPKTTPQGDVSSYIKFVE